MDRGDEKVGDRGNKKDELLGIKLKRGIFVGKKGGQSTPSPTWKLGFGLAQNDSSASASSPFQYFTFPSNFTQTISARKLAANLWEVEPNIESVEMSKTAHQQHRQKHRHQIAPRGCSDDDDQVILWLFIMIFLLKGFPIVVRIEVDFLAIDLLFVFNLLSVSDFFVLIY